MLFITAGMIFKLIRGLSEKFSVALGSRFFNLFGVSWRQDSQFHRV